tara:strand:- start:230 stop:523 length:294 start_codon:yes stop_codon:yes gene_type:complete
MTETPRAVVLYVPLMKDLGISWTEIKKMPAWELEGLQGALNEYNALHAMDGWTSDEVAETAKNKPQIRSSWNDYQEKRAKFDAMIGKKKQLSFDGLM